MSSSYREERRGGQLLDVLTNDTAGVRLIVNRHGAELVSLARRRGAEWSGYLYRDNELEPPAQGWANHATVMGYFLHRLKDGHSLYRGKEIAGGTHSFLRNKEWHFAGAEAGNRLTYQIRRADYTETEYPIDVALDLTYELDGGVVRITFQFQNNDPQLAAHVGFGLHPGFATTTFESLRLVMPAGRYRRHFAPDNYLSGETQDFYFGGGPMPFLREQLPGSIILEFLDVPERTFTFSDFESGRVVDLDLAAAPYVTLWSNGGPFLCVEPCWGLTDYHQQTAFEDKNGIQIIASGASMQRSFTMTPREYFAAADLA